MNEYRTERLRLIMSGGLEYYVPSFSKKERFNLSDFKLKLI